YDPPDAIKDPSGIRLGVQEMTRYGMREDEMDEIARLMRLVAIDRRDPSEIRRRVVELRSGFLEVRYTFPLRLGELGFREALPLLY
ncbi:MAG: serine hydroxymethyltransferase, partial [Candidatus Korarchaeota archaeon]|nr:serine hydroxymethyltransferase [Candidatus Korarchaeota archaeon]